MPLRYTLRAKDGSLELTARAKLNDAAGLRVPKTLTRLFGDFAVDIQLADVSLRFRDRAGRWRTSAGEAEFMRMGGI